MIQYIIILQYAIIVKYFFDFFEKNFFTRQKADNSPTFRDVYPLFKYQLYTINCQLFRLAAPVFAVKASELHRLGDMGLVDNFEAVHIRNSPRYL